jgi:hypothetical protein
MSIKSPRDASVASMGLTQDLGATWSSFATATPASLIDVTLTPTPTPAAPHSLVWQVYKEARSAVLTAKPKEVERVRLDRHKDLNASLHDLPM